MRRENSEVCGDCGKEKYSIAVETVVASVIQILLPDLVPVKEKHFPVLEHGPKQALRHTCFAT